MNSNLSRTITVIASVIVLLLTIYVQENLTTILGWLLATLQSVRLWAILHDNQ